MKIGGIAIHDGEVVMLRHHEQGINSHDYLITICNVRDRIIFCRDHYPNINIDNVPDLLIDTDKVIGAEL